MLRTLVIDDIKKVLAIEKAVHISPWTEETFNICFQAGYNGWVIQQQDQIIGFIIASLTKLECHILNLCVAAHFQRQGWGEKLLQHAMAYAIGIGIHIVYLEVRRSNVKAISLYRKMGFRWVGERKDYYPITGGTEDALIFAKDLSVDTHAIDLISHS